MKAKLNEDTGLWEQAEYVSGGAGVRVSWEQVGRMLQADNTMHADEYVSSVSVDENGVHVLFDRKPG